MGIGHAGTGRDAVGTGIGAEVGVEASVLLHDHHDVANLVNAHGYRQDGEVSASRHAQVVVAAGPRQESSDLLDAGVVKAPHDVELRTMADSRMADSPPVVTAYALLEPDQLPCVIGPKPPLELDPLAEIGGVRRHRKADMGACLGARGKRRRNRRDHRTHSKRPRISRPPHMPPTGGLSQSKTYFALQTQTKAVSCDFGKPGPLDRGVKAGYRRERPAPLLAAGRVLRRPPWLRLEPCRAPQHRRDPARRPGSLRPRSHLPQPNRSHGQGAAEHPQADGRRRGQLQSLLRVGTGLLPVASGPAHRPLRPQQRGLHQRRRDRCGSMPTGATTCTPTWRYGCRRPATARSTSASSSTATARGRRRCRPAGATGRPSRPTLRPPTTTATGSMTTAASRVSTATAATGPWTRPDVHAAPRVAANTSPTFSPPRRCRRCERARRANRSICRSTTRHRTSTTMGRSDRPSTAIPAQPGGHQGTAGTRLQRGRRLRQTLVCAPPPPLPQ